MSESLWERTFMCEAWEPLTQSPSGLTLHFYSTGLSKFTLGGVILHLTSSIINRKQLRSWHWADPHYIYWNTNPEPSAGILLARWCVFLGVGLTCVRKVGSNPVTASIQAQFNSARFQCYLQGLIYLNMNMNMGTCTFCHDRSHRRIVPPGWGLTVNSTSKTL